MLRKFKRIVFTFFLRINTERKFCLRRRPRSPTNTEQEQEHIPSVKHAGILAYDPVNFATLAHAPVQQPFPIYE